jgi:broad specificity phosphatase PhoE
MLTIPSTHLVIISFNDPQNRIRNFYERVGRKAQTTLLIGNHLGDLKILVDNYLPKPAIDRITYKMVDLLNARFGIKEKPSSDPKSDEIASAPNLKEKNDSQPS